MVNSLKCWANPIALGPFFYWPTKLFIFRAIFDSNLHFMIYLSKFWFPIKLTFLQISLTILYSIMIGPRGIGQNLMIFSIEIPKWDVGDWMQGAAHFFDFRYFLFLCLHF